MNLSETTINDLADQLHQAGKNASQIPPITELVPSITVEEAYQVQLRTVTKRLTDGESIVGKK